MGRSGKLSRTSSKPNQGRLPNGSMAARSGEIEHCLEKEEERFVTDVPEAELLSPWLTMLAEEPVAFWLRPPIAEDA